MILHFKNFIGDEETVSTVIIIGYVLAVIFNPVVNTCYLVLLISRKKLFSVVPGWLVIANFIFILLQLQYILFLNDTYHS